MITRTGFAGLAAALLIAQTALGHARLRASQPADGAQLEAMPAMLVLHFNEKVRLATLLLKNSGRDIALSVDRTAPAAADVTLSLPTLHPGTYVVQWRALSGGDGHITQGTFSFSIGGAAHP